MRKAKAELVKLVKVKAEELAKVDPVRVHPVEVVEVEVQKKAPSGLKDVLRTTALVLWTVSGFWLSLAILARLLGF